MREELPIRILGLTLERVANFRQNPMAKSSGLYSALDRRYSVIDVVRPVLNKQEQVVNRLIMMHPSREAWRFRASLSPWAFRRRTAHATEQLERLHGRYDLIVQLHTLLSPSFTPERYRYVLHTDNTYLLSERHFALWAPLRGAAREDWLRMERAVYQNAAFVFPRSRFLQRSLIEDYGCDPERVIVVGGGSNFGTRSLEQKRYDQQIALFVGYDFRRKGGLVLLEAWERVRKVLPDAQLWIVGPKRVERELPGVHWFGRIDDREELARRYSEATAFVMPSLFDPWGHVFFEAMSFGLPCIGSTACAMPEIIQHHITGMLAETGQSEPLADALIAVLGDPQRAEQLGRAAHAHVAQGHTWDDVVERMAPYIEQATADRQAAMVEH